MAQVSQTVLIVGLGEVGKPLFVIVKDASQNRDNWMSPSRLKLLAELEQFKNLYYVNHTETDIATLTGMDAAEAILSGDRTHFDRRIDPAELGIRSESKAFGFQPPVSVMWNLRATTSCFNSALI